MLFVHKDKGNNKKPLLTRPSVKLFTGRAILAQSFSRYPVLYRYGGSTGTKTGTI